MEQKQFVQVVLKVGMDRGIVAICQDPTPAQVRTHFLNLFLYAAFFLAPFVL